MQLLMLVIFIWKHHLRSMNKYMKMPLEFPTWIREYPYNMHARICISMHWETRKAIQDLPQVGALTKKTTREKMKPHDYYKVEHTPGLWKHK